MELEDQQKQASCAIDQQTLFKPDLLFAWLSPIEKKVDHRINPNRPKSPAPPSTVHSNSPFVNKAKSAFRRTFKSSANVPTALRGHAHKLRGAVQGA